MKWDNITKELQLDSLKLGYSLIKSVYDDLKRRETLFNSIKMILKEKERAYDVVIKPFYYATPAKPVFELKNMSKADVDPSMERIIAKQMKEEKGMDSIIIEIEYSR